MLELPQVKKKHKICTFSLIDGNLVYLQCHIFEYLRPVLTENAHRVCKIISFLYACMLCFHICFHLITNVQIIRKFEKTIPIQTLKNGIKQVFVTLVM